MTSWRPSTPPRTMDLTPLIDVVFTLVLFLVLAAQFQEPDAVPVTLPQGSGARPTPVTHTITVSETGLAADGQPMEPEELRDRLVLWATESPESAILLRADGQVDYERVFEVLDWASAADLTRLSLVYERSR